MVIATRLVTVVRSWPYCHLRFIDTATENDVEWAHENPEGIITFSVDNDDFNPKVKAAIADATQLWITGTDFIKIYQKYPDDISNWSATP
jgi:hypothetical protein